MPNKSEYSLNSKCAEIFRISTNHYSYICFHCGKQASSLDSILKHIEEHYEGSAIPDAETAETTTSNTFDCDVKVFEDESYKCTEITIEVDVDDKNTEHKIEEYYEEELFEDIAGPSTEWPVIKEESVDDESISDNNDDNDDHEPFEHNNKTINKQPPISCPICQKTYRTKTRLGDHLGKIHKTSFTLLFDNGKSKRKTYKCKQCERVFLRSRNLMYHRKTCKISKDESDDNDISDCDNELNIKCPICDKMYKTQRYLRDHLTRTHKTSYTLFDKSNSERKTYKCEQCKHVFIHLNNLINHQKNVCGRAKHDDENISDRNNEFNIKFPIDDDEHNKLCDNSSKTIEEQTPNTCPICQKTYSKKKNLQDHLGKVHKTSYTAIFGDGKSNPKSLNCNKLCDNSSETIDKQSPISCPICQKTYRTKTRLGDHLGKTHKTSFTLLFDDGKSKRKTYKCKQCERVFLRSRNLVYHRKTCKISKDESDDNDISNCSKELNNKCPICDNVFKNQRYLREHLTRTHKTSYALLDEGNSERKTYKCEQCKRVFIYLNNLINHQKNVCGSSAKHDEVKEEECKVFSCEKCEMLFENVLQLKRHEFFSHKDKDNNAILKQYKCNKCAYTETNFNAFKLHMSDLHDQTITKYKSPRVKQNILYPKHSHDKPYECEQCGAKFINKGNLDVHSLTHSDKGDDILHCDKCSKPFKSNSALLRHLRQKCNPNRKKFICELCAKEFNYKIGYENHIRMHRGETPYQCYMCGKCFRICSKLTDHLNRIHPTNIYKCPHCDKECRTFNLLNSHIQTHSNSKNFQCTLCKNYFKSRKSLRQHMLIHNDVKLYQCKLCDRKFSQRSGLSGHEKSMHELQIPEILSLSIDTL